MSCTVAPAKALLNWFLSPDWARETMVLVTEVPMFAPIIIGMAGLTCSTIKITKSSWTFTLYRLEYTLKRILFFAMLIHTSPDRDQVRQRKQWVLVPISDQCEHFYSTYFLKQPLWQQSMLKCWNFVPKLSTGSQSSNRQLGFEVVHSKWKLHLKYKHLYQLFNEWSIVYAIPKRVK